MKRLILFILLLPFLQSCFPKVVSAFYSKEYCSCRFVENKSHDQCHWYASQIIPISSSEINESRREVISSAVGFTTKAKWLNPQWGCQIIE